MITDGFINLVSTAGIPGMGPPNEVLEVKSNLLNAERVELSIGGESIAVDARQLVLVVMSMCRVELLAIKPSDR